MLNHPSFYELCKAMNNFRNAVEEAIRLINQMGSSSKEKTSNNWRKMHGLPMKRKCSRKKRVLL